MDYEYDIYESKGYLSCSQKNLILLFIISLTQHISECISRYLIYSKFQYPLMCRKGEREGWWCYVEGIYNIKPLRVPDDACNFNIWCGKIVYDESTPNWITRGFVIWISFFISILVIWIPRIILYRPTSTGLIILRKSVTRPLLHLVTFISVFHLVIETWIVPLMLNPSKWQLNINSSLSWVISILLMSLLLPCWPSKSNIRLYQRPSIHLNRLRNISTYQKSTNLEDEQNYLL